MQFHIVASLLVDDVKDFLRIWDYENLAKIYDSFY
jgi:hypothetical protein